MNAESLSESCKALVLGPWREEFLPLSLSDIVAEAQAASYIKTVDIITCMSEYRRGYGLEIGFMDHLKITTSHAKSLQSAVSSPVFLSNGF
jgi:hypothetical protein